MSDWEIIEQGSLTQAGADLFTGITSLGFIQADQEFTIRHKRSGQTKTVSAADVEELGRRISDGDFDDDDAHNGVHSHSETSDTVTDSVAAASGDYESGSYSIGSYDYSSSGSSNASGGFGERFFTVVARLLLALVAAAITQAISLIIACCVMAIIIPGQGPFVTGIPAVVFAVCWWTPPLMVFLLVSGIWGGFKRK